jgi:hypothetical protein
MHGEWGPREFHLALMGGLLFTSQQAKLVRAEARRRMNLQIGTPKEQRLATIDQRGEPKIIPQSDGSRASAAHEHGDQFHTGSRRFPPANRFYYLANIGLTNLIGCEFFCSVLTPLRNQRPFPLGAAGTLYKRKGKQMK